ncbi:hypothetical protein B1A_21642 [mine drainage metagenome]|uniref:Core-binding (CB) domain-containing protein n=1 Tax=mine drainage metagenome TaxID=410659 RepID=T0ZF56_9ZZZZ
MKAEEVTRAQVRELLEIIARRAPIESNRTLALVRKVFAFALERDVVALNPCIGISRWASRKRGSVRYRAPTSCAHSGR